MILSKSEIKTILALKTAHGRKKHAAFLVEGPKLISELLSSELTIKHLLATEEWISNHYSQIPQNLSIALTPKELDKYSLLKASNQVIAVVNYPNEKELIFDFSKFILVLDTIQDPGNLGTIIRTADWFGIHQILCSKETADLYNPKVVQSAMGSVFRVQLQYTDLFDILKQHHNIPVYGTLLEGRNISEIDFSSRGFVVIGNESKGISDPLLQLVSQAVYIPRSDNSITESLNASVACGILLSHLPK
jgi:TrmH family RNA methyltransferase